MTLSFGNRVGMLFMVEAASLSAFAVTGLLLYIGWQTYKARRKGVQSNGHNGTRPIHLLFLNLMISDLIQALGGMLSIKWIVEAHVEDGPVCFTQGVLKQVGDVGVALTSLALAVHTFCVLVFRVRTPAWWFQSPTTTAAIVITAIWIFIATLVSIGVGPNHNFYVNTGYWCWIGEEFSVQRITLEYLWLWFACFANIVIYGIIALVFRGLIIVDDDNRIQLARGTKRSRYLDRGSAEDKALKSIAIQMLLYVFVSKSAIFPIALVRFLSFSGKPIPFGATIFAGISFALSGVLNVCLFTLTRPSITRPEPVSQFSPPELAHKYTPRGRLPDLEEVPDSCSSPRSGLPDAYGMRYLSSPSEAATGRLPDEDETDSEDDYRTAGKHV